MFGSALKKAFFDLWDNLFFALAINLAFVLGAGGLLLVWFLAAKAGPLLFFVTAPLPFAAATLLGGLADFWAKDAVVHGTAKFGDFASHWAASWKTHLVQGLVWLVVTAGLVFGVEFYWNLNQTLGFIFGVVLMWAVFFLVGMGLYFGALNAQVEPHLGKLVRKAFLVFLANPWASFVLFLGSLVIFVVSLFTAGFFPGIFGLALWLQVGFRFILKKYEWIEANPDRDPKAKVPWTEILADDMERVGTRSFRNLIFPWKD